MSKVNNMDIIYLVVTQDPLTNRPVDYAVCSSEREASRIMTRLLEAGRFAAVAKKRMISDKNS